MSITSKGKKWETQNSLWLIWLFIYMFSWIAFFWIGGRGKQHKWTLFGCLYLVLCFVLPVIGVMLDEGIMDTVWGDILISIDILAWIASIVHGFLSRKEYLIRREAIVANQAADIAAYRQQIQQASQQVVQGYPTQPIYPPTGVQPNPQQYTPLQPDQQQMPGQQASQQPQKIDLNTATEQQLSELPGVGVVLAKRAIDTRMQTGGFMSVKDFCERLELMPHFAVQIENMAFVTPPTTQAPTPEENKGRIIDI